MARESIQPIARRDCSSRPLGECLARKHLRTTRDALASHHKAFHRVHEWRPAETLLRSRQSRICWQTRNGRQRTLGTPPRTTRYHCAETRFRHAITPYRSAETSQKRLYSAGVRDETYSGCLRTLPRHRKIPCGCNCDGLGLLSMPSDISAFA